MTTGAGIGQRLPDIISSINYGPNIAQAHHRSVTVINIITEINIFSSRYWDSPTSTVRKAPAAITIMNNFN